jgi:hypothetical protein
MRNIHCILLKHKVHFIQFVHNVHVHFILFVHNVHLILLMRNVHLILLMCNVHLILLMRNVHLILLICNIHLILLVLTDIYIRFDALPVLSKNLLTFTELLVQLQSFKCDCFHIFTELEFIYPFSLHYVINVFESF